MWLILTWNKILHYCAVCVYPLWQAAEVELRDPTACGDSEEEQASVALKSFIRRKATRLQFLTLTGRLNTHFSRTNQSN